MIVTRSNFEVFLSHLQRVSKLSIDTETTGLRAYQQDRLFSVIIASVEEGDPPVVTPYYFNFQAYVGQDPEQILTPSHLKKLQVLFDDPNKLYYIHNAKFDMAMLANEGLEIKGTIHCTQAIARVEYNQYMTYNLADCAERMGFKKDDTVEKYIKEHGLSEKQQIPGKQKKNTLKFYDRVPFDIIAPYGEQDTYVCANIGHRQEKVLQGLNAKSTQAGKPGIWQVVENERRLTKTVHRMEQRGVLIDRPYCVRALAYEQDRVDKALRAFKLETGREFMASSKLFAEVFSSEKDLWEYTELKNPSFEGDVIRRFKNPAAKCILEYRDAKSKCDFYAGFLWAADSAGVVHPNFNPGGTATGRFSSSEPNFQNLTSEEGDEAQEFLVRRAIIPRPGFIFIMPDFDQMEYRMMFDYACSLMGRETELVKKIKYEGLDPHQATADVVTQGGTPLTRKRAKNGNFAILYGAGYDTLASTIGSTRGEAKELKEAIFKAAPEIKSFVYEVSNTIIRNGYIRNWFGRRSYFPDTNFAYKGPNYLIQGGTADVNKVALNRIDEFLLAKKSKLVLTIHDENPIEVHESEIDSVPKVIKEIMESVYPHQYLPLTVGMEYATKSLGDKIKGFPI